TSQTFNTLKPSTLSSQNEENEQGTMVTTQTPVTQKRTPRGVTSMKNVVCARSKNMKLTVEWNTKGQPCNNKGGNTLVSYIGVLVRHNVSIKFKHWSDERLNSVTDIIWKNITVSFHEICNYSFPCNLFRQLLMYFYVQAIFDVNEQHKDYIIKTVGKALRQFRIGCGKCLRDANGNVNLEPPAKYANLIDETDWVEFVTHPTQE
ncbi:hypothetical protein Lal_00038134, partial [Lupinus albus]